MKLVEKKPKQTINKAYLQKRNSRTEIELFKKNLKKLILTINDHESEEHHKNLIRDFFKETYYNDQFFINSKGRTDLVIHNGSKYSDPVGVIIETKKPTNKSEMVTKSNFNVKAFHELILYFSRERLIENNLEIKYLIITNFNEWFIFNANVFEKILCNDAAYVNKFRKFIDKQLSGTSTDFFYENIAKSHIEASNEDIEYTYFNINSYKSISSSQLEVEDNELIELYKILSPEHLLKLPFENEHNKLNNNFYNELLYIIGLTENKKNKTIELITKNKQSGSIIENIFIQLESLDIVSSLKDIEKYGDTKEKQLFNIALELAINWINRILFLKLLESQLITFNKGKETYSFLNSSKLKTYSDLNNLFFQILAKKEKERDIRLKTIFVNVPYLNSTLFLPTELEKLTIAVNSLDDNLDIEIYSNTVLKDNFGNKRQGKINTLNYIFSFLNAYDFTNSEKLLVYEENKSLINASVLGLIFEKINGYKDGSFYTPGHITMYMTRETLRKSILDKFNLEKKWNAKSFDELYNKIENIEEANTIVNSIKICDPSVGSGHYLVSALNELIAIKSDLRILQDKNHRRIKEHNIEVINDELVITDEDGEFFVYNPKINESQRIQETLFEEKRTIIENCLFGVDINPNSVQICRLRLWIELLKNTYYKQNNELETLPNIDINIKFGNSLVSKFNLDLDLTEAFKDSLFTVETYKNAVETYKNAVDKKQKNEMQDLIFSIKSKLKVKIYNFDPLIKKLSKLKGELTTIVSRLDFFDKQENNNSSVLKLESEINSLKTKIENSRNNRIYESGFEWRIEFPELLDSSGNFIGFDVIIGNPPYLSYYSRQSVVLDSNLESYYNSKYDFLSGLSSKIRKNSLMFFIETGLKLLKDNGYLNFICDLNLLENPSIPIRKFILDKYNLVQVIDQLNVFDGVASGQVIIEIQNRKTEQNNYLLKSGQFIDFIEINQNSIIPPHYTFNPRLSNNIVTRLDSLNFTLDEFFDIKVGMNLGGVKEYFIHDTNEDGNYFRFINGGDNIQRWKITYPSSKQIAKGTMFVDFNKDIQKNILKNKIGTPSIGSDNERFINGKVIIRQSDVKLTAVLDFDKYHCDYNLFTATSLNNNVLELYGLVALLNSDLYTYYVIKKGFLNISEGKTPQIRVNDIKRIPYIDMDTSALEKLKLMVDCIQSKGQDNTIETELNDFIFSLFELSESEIQEVKALLTTSN